MSEPTEREYLEGLRPEDREGDAEVLARVAYVLRDFIHETDKSLCGAGADECPDWPLAYELARRVLEAARLSEPVGYAVVAQHETYGLRVISYSGFDGGDVESLDEARETRYCASREGTKGWWKGLGDFKLVALRAVDAGEAET